MLMKVLIFLLATPQNCQRSKAMPGCYHNFLGPESLSVHKVQNKMLTIINIISRTYNKTETIICMIVPEIYCSTANIQEELNFPTRRQAARLRFKHLEFKCE